jgi:hypothetical protein
MYLLIKPSGKIEQNIAKLKKKRYSETHRSGKGRPLGGF